LEVKKKLKLFVEIYKGKTIKKYGFRFTNASLHKMAGGWLVAMVDWTAKEKEYLFKYCVNDAMMWSTDEVSTHLSFRNLPKNFKTSIEIGLQSLNDKPIGYTVEFFKNTKYGVLVYFAPKGWGHSIDIDHPIEEYDFDNEVELVQDAKDKSSGI
jgi:hypothetical protein